MKGTHAYAVLAALMMAASPRVAPAWGPEGHAVVGQIAERFLTPRAREKIRNILQGQSLGDYEVASWPDIIRGNREYDTLYPHNSRWHYVDLNVYAPREELRLPEDGQDVVNQIRFWRQELGRARLARARRLDALRFLVHFVGDVHQPLHCAYRYNDLGGNLIPVHSFRGAHFEIDADTPMDRLPNLHSVWDEYLVYELLNGLEPPVLAAQLADTITLEQRRQWTTSDPLDWAFESHELARTRAYRFSDGGNVPFTWSRPGMDLTRENYIDAAIPVVREQLQKAGVRLAHLLNSALDPPRNVPAGSRSPSPP